MDITWKTERKREAASQVAEGFASLHDVWKCWRLLGSFHKWGIRRTCLVISRRGRRNWNSLQWRQRSEWERCVLDREGIKGQSHGTQSSAGGQHKVIWRTVTAAAINKWVKNRHQLPNTAFFHKNWTGDLSAVEASEPFPPLDIQPPGLSELGDPRSSPDTSEGPQYRKACAVPLTSSPVILGGEQI